MDRNSYSSTVISNYIYIRSCVFNDVCFGILFLSQYEIKKGVPVVCLLFHKTPPYFPVLVSFQCVLYCTVLYCTYMTWFLTTFIISHCYRINIICASQIMVASRERTGQWQKVGSESRRGGGQTCPSFSIRKKHVQQLRYCTVHDVYLYEMLNLKSKQHTTHTTQYYSTTTIVVCGHTI